MSKERNRHKPRGNKPGRERPVVEAGQAQVFGLHAVNSLLRHQAGRVHALQVQEGRRDARMQEVLDLAQAAGIAVSECPRETLDQLTDGVHQGVIALVEPRQAGSESDLEQLLEQAADKPLLLLVLDGVTDPHNLGACIRTADAAGADAVIVPRDKSAGLNATVRKVACGAAESVPLIQVTNLARTLRSLADYGVWVLGTAGEAEQLLYQVDLKASLALVMGAEGRGMRRLTREHCDQLVKLPMAGEVSSLNVSVAAGVALYEVVRQRLV
ncbi:23S rRNA (guanosine(2251)-2'-O)-methyltransferase RlmB [Marinospirillum alkaliphilum]|jgi:23S rRNA (guanosine2251-2'-O)-methyltransferase|uniref:23S rRNA (guanosine-2'-O-)-methyltransferase RlmB n=1 Tax=Marinospirillum alkaliphilum DSM 21637 TaxID=1122209 RepID=A0A1K1ZIV4_9GAMM|nr:23S rRNA (guanosine(2251)-2'-O)-methyltransferase RlmB [Marinospirillum alkaliphilum]SFX73651.1 23S rRNA Gm-2251 2'-O-methyltransferase [Marinospirillum alkaliphilum DSM 21637]